ncbi:MAG: efflux RND transporter permease subunit [Bacteroides sp.]|nr:efflux RND transporter permease subunit [Bacteroides sp.]
MKKLSPFTVIITFIALALMGVALIPRLPVKLVPSQSLPSLTVSFNMGNSAARVVENEVTSKLESMFARVQGIKEINSVSGNGYGRITLGIDKHADIDNVRFEISTIVRQAWSQLPDGVTYPQIYARAADQRSTAPFLSYAINAPVSAFDIQNYANDNISPVLGQIKGVDKVEITGAMPMQWTLEYDSDKLHSLALTPSDISKAIAESDVSQFLGIAEFNDEWLRVRAMTSEHGSDLRVSDINVSTPDGKMIPLDKLVTVSYEEAEPSGYFRINGLNSVYCNITADEEANQLELAETVKTVMAELISQMPEGYYVSLQRDSTESIKDELNKIYFRSGLTFLILLLFVALITLDLRYMMIVTVSLIINLAVAVILYYALDVEIQLYTLAGITISLNLIIDNIIVMTDHITHKGNLKAFTSVMAATLTTIGALSIVFFLNQELRLTLQDFVIVVMINLTVSLFVALFLVPALISESGMSIVRGTNNHRRRRRRWTVLFNRLYARFILFCQRHRVVAVIVLVLIFGLPVHMLPDKIESENKFAAIYNSVFGSPKYKEKWKPIVDKALGGTLRLFAVDVYNGSYFNRNLDREPVLYVSATLPNGATLSQMNELIMRMESFLTTFPDIRQFHTRISSPNLASLQIFFTKDAQQSAFPYRLKSDIIAKAQTLGGGSWGVYGLEDQGFSNDVRESTGSYRVKMLGYNYDDLEQWADSMKSKLLEHRRIKEVTVSSEFKWYKEDYSEVFLDVDKERLAKENITVAQLYSALSSVFGGNITIGEIMGRKGPERIVLHSRQGRDYDVWGLMNMPISIGRRTLKLTDLATVSRREAPVSIAKENQEYRLCLQYEYIGSATQGNKVLEADVDALNAIMPMGYKAKIDGFNFYRGDDAPSYWLLLLVIAIIFFITGILFNSLVQPLAIIFTIPISFIGVFLIFYLTGVNFDQGGYASFILLCGITVNASIYILNEYNSLRARYPHRNRLQLYIKAWDTKVLPIFLTVVSTILGFIPFMVGTGKESFWYPMALGTIGGLLMSLTGIFVYLPVFALRRPPRKKKARRRRRPQ